MDRREFSKRALIFGFGAYTALGKGKSAAGQTQEDDICSEPSKKLPIRKFDVAVVGGDDAVFKLLSLGLFD